MTAAAYRSIRQAGGRMGNRTGCTPVGSDRMRCGRMAGEAGKPAKESAEACPMALLARGESRIATCAGIGLGPRPMVDGKIPGLRITAVPHHTVTECIVETTGGADNRSCRQRSNPGRAQVCTAGVANGTGGCIGGIRILMGAGAGTGTDKPWCIGMRCPGMASQAILLGRTGTPVVGAVTVCAERHAIYPDGRRLGVGTVLCRSIPADRVSGGALSMTCYTVSIRAEAADVADTALQIGSVAFLTFVRSSQVGRRMISAV